jgi:hypothetical protein
MAAATPLGKKPPGRIVEPLPAPRGAFLGLSMEQGSA